MSNKSNYISEIKNFLDGYNNDLKYLVNVETTSDSNYADCVIHEPGCEPKINKVKYTPFLYMKDLRRHNLLLYNGNDDRFEAMKGKYGITIEKLKTGNQKRLIDGFCYKLTSTKSYNAIVNFLKDGGIYPYEKIKDHNGNIIKDANGDAKYLYRDMFYSPRTTEQFFISTQSRLYKGIEEYNNIHKVTFDIETTGLRFQMARVIQIGVRDNRGFETILEATEGDDDIAEKVLIEKFFRLIVELKPAIVCGYNSEDFDFNFLLGRGQILGVDFENMQTTLNKSVKLNRRDNVSVKYGNTADRFTATEIWGISVIDILHASKRTAAINSDLKETKLKYISKYEKISKDNRTYISGEDNGIGKMYSDDKIFVINEKNDYLQIPEQYQELCTKLYDLQKTKSEIDEVEYKKNRNELLENQSEFIKWYKQDAIKKNMSIFITGKDIVRQYLLDDLWETEQVDELYNQSSFMLAKIVPTTYQRICTMGTAAIWNLLLTAWSYENDLAIPESDISENFSGGLARCYKTGYSKKIAKIDYASLYPMIQLSDDVFPIFDITGVIKKMLSYLTTTRNIYKKLASGDVLNNDEIQLLEQIDLDTYTKFINNKITEADKAIFKIKQLPIKILNNSLFGALGSGISFNWSDNICAARITCSGRLHLRHAVSWFKGYDCEPLLAVTDGINFQIPEKSKIKVTDTSVEYLDKEEDVDIMWQYGGKVGVGALIEKYNKEEMKSKFMSVDNDGEFISCLNLSRINYATLLLAKDKKSGEMKEKIKLTGNTIKSKTMPEYIQEFIDNGLDLILHGKGSEFVEYYQNYAENIFYKQIPLKKIASKNKIKTTINAYQKRGKDKNGREKGMQAHMELLIEKRNNKIEELFEKYKHEFDLPKSEDKLSINDKHKLVLNYMPADPEIDSVVYYVNTGYLKSHSSSGKIIDKVTNKERFASMLIENEDLLNNPNLIGDYNVVKYLDAFNSRVKSLLVGFDPEISDKILVKVNKKKKKDENGNNVVVSELIKNTFTNDELILKNYNSDDYDESMYLEEKEVQFWNRTGYDPRLIWDGFKMRDDDRVYYEIYDNALIYLNELMLKNGKGVIKSVNDKWNDGDLILFKDNKNYSIGKFNGIYVEIVRESVDIPKSEIEIELERREMEKQKKLELTLNTESDAETQMKQMEEKRIKYFDDFKEQFKLPIDITIDVLFTSVPNAKETLDLFIANIDKNQSENSESDIDVDEDNF
jgi:DNA polymerase elongation subunit (family B)